METEASKTSEIHSCQGTISKQGFSHSDALLAVVFWAVPVGLLIAFMALCESKCGNKGSLSFSTNNTGDQPDALGNFDSASPETDGVFMPLNFIPGWAENAGTGAESLGYHSLAGRIF